MLGAIAGDIIGSLFEARPVKTKDFPLFSSIWSVFTDDTVLTVAVADSILNSKPYKESILKWGRAYPNAGYGASFINWLSDNDPQPYNSYGNGAAMRVSPVGFAYNSEAEVLDQAKATAVVSHDHPEGIKGAQAVAYSVFLMRKGFEKDALREDIAAKFGYDLDRQLNQIRPNYKFDVSCQGSVPEAILCFLESYDYEDAIRNAISLGGDSDTLACMAGAIAEAYYEEIPDYIRGNVIRRITPEMHQVIDSLYKSFPQHS